MLLEAIVGVIAVKASNKKRADAELSCLSSGFTRAGSVNEKPRATGSRAAASVSWDSQVRPDELMS